MIKPVVLPRIKVCGLTREVDVAVALEAGADALGCVLHAPSPRSVSAARAATLLAGLEGRAVGVLVLVNAEPRSTLELVRQTAAGAVQLCGTESAEAWHGFPTPILRRVAVDPDATSELEDWAGVAAGFVLDHPSAVGGSGLRVDVRLARDLARRARCLLAGGLDPECVREAVQGVQPHGVDASSGLECSPGTKSADLVRNFVERSRAALSGGRS